MLHGRGHAARPAGEGGGERGAGGQRYNSGQPETAGTTGHDYGPDVVERMQALRRLFVNDDAQGPVPAWFTRDLGIASPFMQGSDVGVVQKKTGADPDGVFGPVTREHVVNFQSPSRPYRRRDRRLDYRLRAGSLT